MRSIQTICFAVMFGSWLVYGQVTSVPELDQMQAKFDAAVQEEAYQPFAAALLKLNQTYAASLDKEIVAAQRAGRLNDVLHLQTEKELAEKPEALPPQDAVGTSPAIKTLRARYNVSLAQITAERDKKLKPMKSTYAKSLAGLVSTLTKAGRIEDAKVVDQRRIDFDGSTDLRHYEGTWDVTYGLGAVRRYRFSPAGKVEWLEGDKVRSSTRAFRKGNDLMLDWKDGKFERLSLKAGKVIVEHFDPSTRYPKEGPNTVGTGERVK